MRIDLYTMTWNDKTLLPHFLRHYASWVDRIVVFDDYSDDGTRDLLQTCQKVEMRNLPDKGDSFVLTALNIWNHAWKESRGRADWVIVTNVDEFFVHRHGESTFLESLRATAHTIVHPLGFEMYGAAFPDSGAELVRQVPHGVALRQNDKMQIFNPNAISEMNYSPGRHVANPMGEINIAREDSGALLHYKLVDLENYTIPRQHALGARMLSRDRANHFGFHYHRPPVEIRAAAEWVRRHAADVHATTFGLNAGQV
jgi:glycosyltransferase involved in cell wall biosynthesis